jgi:hypothetical protein
MNRPLLLALVALLPACSSLPPPVVLPGGQCPIVGSSDWQAWANAMPGPGSSPTLIVTGKVAFPTGGWRIDWRDLRVMESYPVQVAVELEPIRPAGGATQAVTVQDVRGSWPINPPVGSLSISCRGTVIARIAPVETAH